MSQYSAYMSWKSELSKAVSLLSSLTGIDKKYLLTMQLTSAEVEAIEKGYKSREEIYLNAFKRDMDLPKTINDRNRLNILANLIEAGILEIKIAVRKPNCYFWLNERI